MKKTLTTLIILLPFLLLAQDKSGTFKVRKAITTSEMVESIYYGTMESVNVVEVMPQYPGGQGSLMRFLSANLVYPDILRNQGIQGTLYVNFTVSTTGIITNVRVLRGVHQALDQEAVRVISMMPNWSPGSQRGAFVNVMYNFPITFKLN